MLVVDVFLEAITLLEYEYRGVDVLNSQGVLFMTGADYFSKVVVVILE